jgi:hypothetical protein
MFAYEFTIHSHKPIVAFLPRAVEVSTPSEAILTEDSFVFVPIPLSKTAFISINPKARIFIIPFGTVQTETLIIFEYTKEE